MRAGSHYTQPKHQATSQHSYLSGGSSYAPSYARSGYAPSYATARSGYAPSFATARSGYAPSVSPPPYMRGGEYDIPSVSPQQMSPGSAYYSPSTIMSYHTRGVYYYSLYLVSKSFLPIELCLPMTMFCLGRLKIDIHEN